MSNLFGPGWRLEQLTNVTFADSLQSRCGMNADEVLEVVRKTLEKGKQHWLLHGTPIRPEDAELVAVEVFSELIREESDKRLK